MVNENQIVPNDRHLTQEATELFIQSDHLQTTPPDLYNLDAEFANKKGNKNKVIWLTLPLFVILSLAAAYFVTKYIEESSSKIPISIDAFEDVNLREIFDKAKQNEKEMEKARRDLEDLYIQKAKEKENLNSIANREIDVIKLDGKNVNERIYIVESTLKSDLIASEEKWDILISKAKEKITSIQEKIDSYDTRIMEKAKEQENIINNQQKRFDIEMEETRKYYEEKINSLVESHLNELKTVDENHKKIVSTINKNNKEYITSLEKKYNPEFNDSFSFLKKEIKKPKITPGIFRTLDKVLYTENLLSVEKVTLLRSDVLTGLYTFNELKKVPYYNSPSEAIDYLETLYISNINNYVELAKKLIPNLKSKRNTISKQTTEIGKLSYFLTDYIKSNRINGLIIDPREENIKVFIDSIYQVKNGTIAYIFRNDSDYLGTIKLVVLEDESYIGQIVQLLDPNRGLKPFDMILLEIE